MRALSRDDADLRAIMRGDRRGINAEMGLAWY
jgi:hypothetical protein